MLQSLCVVMVLFGVGACANKARIAEQQRQKDVEKIESTLGEVSLKADRDHLAELRKDIPQETKKANDELALQLSLMQHGTENPSRVRERFHHLIQTKRTDFRGKVKKLRDEFRDNERKRRELYLNEAKKKRDAFTRRKREPKETREFFSEQDKQRQAYFADERDRRRNFEAEINAQSRDFDSYMRERQSQFNEEFRLYSKRISEKPKPKKAVTGDVNDINRIDQVPTLPLGTEP